MKITKCNENKVLFCKVTNRAAGPTPATYGGNQDVSGVAYVELRGLLGKRLKCDIHAIILALRQKK